MTRHLVALALGALGLVTFAAQSSTARADAVAAFPYDHNYGVTCAHGGHESSLEACTKYCASACDVGGDPKKASCPRIPTAGKGLLQRGDAALLGFPKFNHITIASDSCEKGMCTKTHSACSSHSDCGNRATKDVIDGLTRLDKWIDTSPDMKGYSMHVTQCWRDGTYESKEECYFLVNGKDPVRQEGLAWPGANPHSSGHGCDIYLMKGTDQVLPHGMHDKSTGACKGITEAHAATKLMVDALTNSTVGAKRLGYEPWHFEWGGPDGCKCAGKDCEDKYWPPTCTSSQCK